MTVRAVSPGTGRVRTGRVGAQGSGGGTVPASPSVLMENGTDHLLMENGTDRILMEA